MFLYEVLMLIIVITFHVSRVSSSISDHSMQYVYFITRIYLSGCKLWTAGAILALKPYIVIGDSERRIATQCMPQCIAQMYYIWIEHYYVWVVLLWPVRSCSPNPTHKYNHSVGYQPDEPPASLVTINRIINMYGFLVVKFYPRVLSFIVCIRLGTRLRLLLLAVIQTLYIEA